MIKVKLTTPFPEWPLVRQTPGSKGVWANCAFVINDELAECAWWVVYEDLLQTETVNCSRSHTIFITGEPETVKEYPPAFLTQFGTVITSHRNLDHPNVLRVQQALPWHIGLRQNNHAIQDGWLYYDQLKVLQPSPKAKCMSVMCSDKDFTDGHRRRLAFTRKLSEHFGNRLDVFGHGVREIEDKWEALAEYKYHVVLENSSCPHYWSEKLSDAYLGWTYPFYYGCPNLEEYFTSNAFVRVDIMDPVASIEIMEQAIAQHVYEQQLVLLAESRTLILERYNLFSLLAKVCTGQASQSRQETTIFPVRYFQSRRRAVAGWLTNLLGSA